MANKFKVDLANLFTNWDDDVGAWASSSGGAGIVSHPTVGDDATVNENSGNLVINVDSACDNFFSNSYAGTMSGSSKLTVTGLFAWIGGVNPTWTGELSLTPAGLPGAARRLSGVAEVAFPGSVTINASSGTNGNQIVPSTVPGDASLEFAGVFTLTQGIARFSNIGGGTQRVAMERLVSSNTNTRAIQWQNLPQVTLEVTGTGTVVDCSISTNMAVSGVSLIACGDIEISDTSETGKTFAGGGLTWGGLIITGSAGAVTFTGDNTFGFSGNQSGDNRAFVSGASPLVFTGTTTTFHGAVTLTGCLSITGGTWSKARGTVTAPAGCVITNNIAIGGAFFDGRLATNAGGNYGWFFGATSGQAGPMFRYNEFGRHVGRYWRRVR